MTYSQQRRMRHFQERKGLREPQTLFQIAVCIILTLIFPLVVFQFATAKQEVNRYSVATAEVQR